MDGISEVKNMALIKSDVLFHIKGANEVSKQRVRLNITMKLKVKKNILNIVVNYVRVLQNRTLISLWIKTSSLFSFHYQKELIDVLVVVYILTGIIRR